MMDDTRVLTILIVDDSATDRAIIRGMLGEYNTLTAADGVGRLWTFWMENRGWI